MRHKNTVFYRNNKAIKVNFSGEEISSDGAVILLEKIERESHLIKNFSEHIPEYRDPLRIIHSTEKMLKQRVFMMMQGYEDANDVTHLKTDPIFKDILEGDMASQPTISRYENSFTKKSIFALCYVWLDNYILSLKGRKEIIIDVDATNDPTHGCQQLSMFNGYYGQTMYDELFFHDGDTGQIILPVLRPGNSHSNKWFVAILKRIIRKIRATYPNIKITIRGDSGFSGPQFYKLAEEYELEYAVGMPTNAVLKRRVSRAKKAVSHLYLSEKKKHQHFISFSYQAKTWHKAQQCHSKIESTGKGMNIRHIVSNIEEQSGREIYFDFYVKRGETSENRIKEVKNMCYSDRLSNHGYWANFFRLLISSLAYEMFLLIKERIKKTKFKKAKKWQINTIRTLLLKIGATIKITKRRIYYKLSKAFVYQNLFLELIYQSKPC